MATFIPSITDVFPQPKLYTPDFSFIDKMLQRKEAQYEQGFAQLNNQYRNINRAVTHDFYGKQRDKFLNDAKVNLKNLSAMDLSDPQNVREATNVFKPIYSNKELLMDQAATAYWNSQLALGESLRTKDGGKEYSEDNMNYIRLQMQAYKNDDPSTIGEYYSQKRGYTPYHDYHKNVQEAMKNFKPSHTKMQQINGMWIVTTENQSWTELELEKYLDGVLSDADKRQMRIEGAVRLGTNEQFLANQYMTTEGAKVPEIGKLIDKLDAEIKTEKDPNKLAQLKLNREYFDDQRTEISNNLKSIRSGDLTFVKKNAESLAFKPYYSEIVSKKAGAFAHNDVSQSYDINQVAKMYWENEQDWAKRKYENAFEWQKMVYQENAQDRRDALKSKAESMKGITDPISVEIQGEVENTTLAALNQKMKIQTAEKDVAYDNLKDVIARSNNVGRANIVGNYGLQLWNKYIRENPNDKYVRAYLESRQKIQTTEGFIASYKTEEDNAVRSQLGEANFNNLQKYNKLVKQLQEEAAQSQRTAIQSGNTSKLSPIMMPTFEAAKRLGFDAKTMAAFAQTERQIRKTYNADEHRISVKNQSGFTLGAEDPRTKSMLSKIEGAGIFKMADIIGGPQYFPKADGSGYSIRIRLNPGSKTFETADAAKKETDKLRLMFGVGKGETEDVVYDPGTHSIVFKGLGGKFAQELDPYNMVPPIHRNVLDMVESSSPPVGKHSPDNPMIMSDINGGVHFVNIKKYQPGGTDQSSYDISIDGKLIKGRHFDNTIGAYLTLQNMMNIPYLNESLNQAQ
jgi:hypothetical protein